MDKELIKAALSYSLGSDLHEAWRTTKKREDGSYEPTKRKSKDETWNSAHGTDEVDIANCSFEELPTNCQYDNLASAKILINLVFDKVMAGEVLSLEEEETYASIIHEEWLRRNSWVFDSEHGNPKLAVSYINLPQEDKDKYKSQLDPAIRKVQDYIDGLIDIDEICETYKIS